MLEKINKSINLFMQNWMLFSMIVLTVWLPASILLVYLRWYVFPEMTGGDELQILAKEYRVQGLIETIFGPFCTGALIYALAQIKQDAMPTYGECMAHAARRSFKLVGTRIGTGLIVVGGFLLLIVPGIILALRYALTDTVVTLDRIDGANARKYSAQLTEGKRGELLGTMIISFSLVLLASVFVSLLFSMFISEAEGGIFVLDVLYECLIQLAITVITTTILFLFYWESKEQES
ncbi:hypothetical protein [Oscillatoria acuminata]|uniref:Glycerophosphoryl diester phosphodiesterase membrane domain-containing protein n=1 Tax=Oscillatoria acuminata PCC 6304 TaxID=56110 RepID=K9TIQ6_9CYAN|nr:hypothetical protein [Oscillatoria acuminata]AFY82430.1 hypothetical protein Oscil6304_2828 [Oscillatoria acuminata PCC 6304]